MHAYENMNILSCGTFHLRCRVRWRPHPVLTCPVRMRMRMYVVRRRVELARQRAATLTYTRTLALGAGDDSQLACIHIHTYIHSYIHYIHAYIHTYTPLSLVTRSSVLSLYCANLSWAACRSPRSPAFSSRTAANSPASRRTSCFRAASTARPSGCL